jgi:hypothetical protein
VIGYWEDNKDGAVKKHYNSNGSVTGTQVAAEHQDGPTGIVIDVDAFSWGLANYVAPEHVDTVRNHKLATGLTETEARVAMYGKESQSTQENGVTKIKFYQPPPPDAVGTGPRQHRGPQGARNDAAAAGGGGGGGAGGGGGGGRGHGGGGGGFSSPPAQPGPNPAAQNTVAVAAHPSGGYDGEVKIPGTDFASDYRFSEDVGNVGEKATLVATAIVKDAHAASATMRNPTVFPRKSGRNAYRVAERQSPAPAAHDPPRAMCIGVPGDEVTIGLVIASAV